MEDTITLIDSSLKELNTAIQHHYEWLNTLLLSATFNNAFPLALTHEHSHLNCKFSLWMNRFKDKINTTNFSEIESRHKAMHEEMRNIIDALENKRASEALLSQFSLCQQRFINEIDRYKEQLISLRNMHDSLTALPLRGLLYNDFEKYIERCEAENAHGYLMMLDVDHFKK